MSLVGLNDVSVRYENAQILREAFFRLEDKDRVGLIGRNGSGKTTLLKLVLDQVQPDGSFNEFVTFDGGPGATVVVRAASPRGGATEQRRRVTVAN